MIVTGIDPDAKKYGVAKYIEGELRSLASMDIIDMIDHIQNSNTDLYVIENVMANTFKYSSYDSRFKGKTKDRCIAISHKIGQGLGRCMHSQEVLMTLLDSYEKPYILEKPQKGNWAKDKAKFTLITKWLGRSNEDTRSAAYFGYLYKDHRL